MVRDRHETWRRVAVALPVEDGADASAGRKPLGQFCGLRLQEPLQGRLRRFSGRGFKLCPHLGRQLLQDAAELHRKLLADGLAVRILIRRDQFLDELRKADRGIDHHRLHVGEVLEMRIEVHGIEDAEHLLANLGAKPRRAADHLLIEDAAVDPPQEHEIGDRRHVDAGGEKIDRDRNPGIGVVAEGADQRPNPVHAAGDLLHRRVVNLSVFLRKRLLDFSHHDVRMGIGRREDQRLTGRARTDRCGLQVPRQPRD